MTEEINKEWIRKLVIENKELHNKVKELEKKLNIKKKEKKRKYSRGLYKLIGDSKI